MESIHAHKLEFYSKLNWKLQTQWRWRIKANNGKIIGSSSEGYHNYKDCVTNAKSVALSIRDHFMLE